MIEINLAPLTCLTSTTKVTTKVVTFTARARGGEDNVLHADRHSSTFEQRHKLDGCTSKGAGTWHPGWDDGATSSLG